VNTALSTTATADQLLPPSLREATTETRSPIVATGSDRHFPRRPNCVTVSLLLLFLFTWGCASVPDDYLVREGDIVFQSAPRSPLVDAIEGMTKSTYSHCGIVAKREGAWVVIEALGPVMETPLRSWIARGRGHHFAAYRLEPSFESSIPGIIESARRYLGRPYDIHFEFDEEKIYCSELVFKAVRMATGRSLGHVDRVGELDWRPHEKFIRTIEAEVPLDRELITPVAISRAKELTKVYAH
jgi:hypothetical protein